MTQLAQLTTAVVCHPGKDQRDIEDCYLSGGFIPDRFTRMSAGEHDVDYTAASSPKRTSCQAVFVQVGGGGDGDRLTRLAAENLRAEVSRIAILPLNDLAALFKRYTTRVQEQIRQIIREENLPDQGVALACACIRENQAVVFLLGSCQAYLYHQGQIQRLDDHAAKSQPTYLGMPEDQGMPACRTIGLLAVQDRDRLLICSGSLPRMLSDSALLDCLEIPDLSQAASQLFTEAKNKGVRENITAILADLSEAAARQPFQAQATADFMKMHQPHPHIDHQSKRLKVLVEKKTFDKSKIRFNPIYIWQYLPVWLQFWSMITLLLLITLLVVLLGPRLWG